MDKIYLKDNYIVTELGGLTTVFPKNYSSYSENTTGFYLNSSFPVNNPRTVFIDFTRVTSIYDEAGLTAYSVATLRSFFLTNTGFKSPSGGSGGVWGSITGTLSDQTDLQSALNAKQNTLISGINIKTINGNTLLGSGDLTISTGITVGTTPVTSGTDGRVFFQSGGVVQQDSSLFWDNTNKRLYLNQGATPLGVIDVRGQSALSTHFILRTRNSADTRNFLVVNGAGDVFNNGAGGVQSSTLFGENAGRSATGNNNSLFGFNAGSLITTAAGNSFFGRDCGQSNTADNNSFYGTNAGKSNSTGTLNCFFGVNSGASNTTSSNNSFFGTLSGNQSSGANNSFFGKSSGQGNTSGFSNVFVGTEASINNATGSNNVTIGAFAARFNAAGASLTVANDSVFIGSSTRANDNSQTNQIVIGFNAIGTGSNSVTLGNTSITRTNLRGQVVISGFAAAPVGVEGAIYYDSTTKKHYGFDGTNWNALY